ncbi:MAG: formamidopyrimidine-DNA glycosylase [Nitrospinae bacterium CG11_big_fil_rev_8_21_14_0_20_56_8]|nr:MAG: formamidopyrimidine-DNA glycosylase [Nitrospinae bacterium CG11_big_fil_rev_8_21_14_0_20_56_8]
MPELPEVETLKNALLPLVKNKTLLDFKLYRPDLRFPIPGETLRREVLNHPIVDLSRKGKYLLLHTATGAMIWHLGMSGRVTEYPAMIPREKHTHAVFKFTPGQWLHFIDPRRFGCIVWASQAEGHPLINHLGPDPLDLSTTAIGLKTASTGSKVAIKQFLMDSRRLAGVGNIYACEALHQAGIHPSRQAGRLSLKRWDNLLESLRTVLNNSIASGGTTLRDFFNTDGSRGYFALRLTVYGREGQPCLGCASPVRRMIQSGRSTFYCKACQS